MCSSKVINRFTKLRIQKHKQLNHLNFLLFCKRKKLIPQFINVRCNLKPTINISKTLTNVKFAFLRAVIKDTRLRISNIEKELYILHLRLSKELSDFQKIEKASWARAQNVSTIHKTCLDKKLNKLMPKYPSLPAKNDNQENAIINMSSVQLSENQIRSLKYNNNFSENKVTDITKIIAPIETSLKMSGLSNNEKDVMRHLISNKISTSIKKRHSPNLTKDEKNAWYQLKSNPNLIITKADKGGKIVLMDKQQYIDGTKKLLEEGPYSQLKKDPTDNYLRKVKQAIKKTKVFNEQTKRKVTPTIANCARFYALPKVHKIGIPFRPIVSTIGTASYLLSKHLASIFSTLRPNTFTVKNSLHFISKLRQVTLNANDVYLVSFDVKSLFTNVPIEGALQCLTRKLLEFHYSSYEVEELLILTRLCLEQNSFIVDNKYYKQIDGLAMGNPLSPILSDIYLHYFELELFSTLSFLFWVRYVDDIFVIWHQSLNEIPNVLQRMNSINSHIQFTVEVEQNCSLPFLDTVTTRKNGYFETTVYRKDHHISLPPHSKSNHPTNQKLSSFFTYVFRAINICSSTELLKCELNVLKSIAINRGFNPTIIDHCFRKLTKPKFESTLTPETKDTKIGTVVLPYTNITNEIAKVLKRFNFNIVFKPIHKLQFSQLKSPIPDGNCSGIYQIFCNCGLSYIGQTKRAVKLRAEEHRNYVKNKELEKSSIAKHCWTTGHNFNFNNFKILHRPYSNLELDFLESFEIFCNRNTIVNDENNIPFLSNSWKLLANK